MVVISERPEEEVLAALRAAGSEGHWVSIAEVDIDTGLSVPFVIPGLVGIPEGVLVRSLPLSHTRELGAGRYGLLEAMDWWGIPVYNRPVASALCRNKLMTSVVLAAGHVPTPQVFVTSSLERALSVVAHGRWVLKPLLGTNGVGVTLAEGGRLQKSPDVAYLQGMVDTRRGEQTWEDYRVLVSGSRAVAQMKRVAQQWNLGYSTGATPVASALPEIDDLAVQACSVLGLGFGGVDIAVGAEGPQVIEVNSVPQDFSSAYVDPVDIATAIVSDFLAAVLPGWGAAVDSLA